MRSYCKTLSGCPANTAETETRRTLRAKTDFRIGGGNSNSKTGSRKMQPASGKDIAAEEAPFAFGFNIVPPEDSSATGPTVVPIIAALVFVGVFLTEAML